VPLPSLEAASSPHAEVMTAEVVVAVARRAPVAS
jgi:hypothetical protein